MTEPSVPWVYAWPQSVQAGDTVAIRAAGPPLPAEVRVVRIGVRPEIVWTTTVELAPHDVPDDAAAHGCPWPDAATLEIPERWRSGYYEVVLRAGPEFRHEAVGFFVVRATSARPERPLLVLTTNTWNAYNDFGGPNLYTGGTQVSFARPLAPGFLRKPPGPGQRVAVVDGPDRGMRAHIHYLLDHGFSEWAGSAGWPNAERQFVHWAEGAGYELDYATNADLETVPGLLDGRRLYLSVGHDEYWTWAMRDAVESFVAGGGHAAFLSGNTSFWQVRLAPGGPDGADQIMIGYKQHFADDPVLGTADPTRVSSLWSDRLVGRPENHMTGVSFARGGYHRIGRAVGGGAGGYTVYRPDHWVFDGVEVDYGDLIGAGSVVVGYECDGCELPWSTGCPSPPGPMGPRPTSRSWGWPRPGPSTAPPRCDRFPRASAPRSSSTPGGCWATTVPKRWPGSPTATPSWGCTSQAGRCSPPAAPTGPGAWPALAPTRSSNRSPATSSTASPARAIASPAGRPPDLQGDRLTCRATASLSRARGGRDQERLAVVAQLGSTLSRMSSRARWPSALRGARPRMAGFQRLASSLRVETSTDR